MRQEETVGPLPITTCRSNLLTNAKNRGQNQTSDEKDAIHEYNEICWTRWRQYYLEERACERTASLQASEAKPKYCYERGKFLGVVIAFGMLSTAISCAVYYVVLIQEQKCQCSSANYNRGN